MTKKKSLNEVREEMLQDEEELGILYIDEKYKEDGYHYRIVDADKVNRVSQLLKKGYEIVENPDLKSGQGEQASRLGATVTFELGIHSHRQGILMRISKDKYEQRMKMKEKKANEQLQAIGQGTGIPDSCRSGEFTMGSYSKKL